MNNTPLANLLMNNLLVAITPGGIEEQEKMGQSQLTLTFDRLPRQIDEPSGRHMLEQLGFVFGENLDDLFVSVEPPQGWTLRPSSHSMWSYVHDEQGRCRASVFYKAAFYDKSAHVSIDRRFGISRYQACDVDGHRIVAGDNLPEFVLCEIVDHDKSCVIVIGKRERTDYEQADVLDARAEAWLEENKPDWRNPLAYW
jgi:hypothetical protein